MKEVDPAFIRQSVCVDRIRQLRNGLRQIDLCNNLVEQNYGHYDVVDSRDDAETYGETIRIDRPLVKAIEGGVAGVYHELVEYGEKDAANAVIWQYKRSKEMGDGS